MGLEFGQQEHPLTTTSEDLPSEVHSGGRLLITGTLTAGMGGLHYSKISFFSYTTSIYSQLDDKNFAISD